jgi:hypothetical protein
MRMVDRHSVIWSVKYSVGVLSVRRRLPRLSAASKVVRMQVQCLHA